MPYTNSIKHPKCFNVYSKTTQTSDDYLDSIQQSLRNLLLSSKGELLGDPNYGTDIMKLMYDNNNLELNYALKKDIVNQINIYEKRVYITQDNITFINDRTKIYMTIKFLIKRTDEVFDMEILLRNTETYSEE